MDKEMYDGMSILSPPNEIVSRGIAVHKLIRFITNALGGDGYMNFMGNEFGHPEWIDFPRDGNGWSYHYARRRFDLVADPLLRYQHLYLFDVAVNRLEEAYRWLAADQAFVSLKHEGDKLIVFERAGLLFVFNFHPVKSFIDYRIGTQLQRRLKLVLNSDWVDFGGFALIRGTNEYVVQDSPWHDQPRSFLGYFPSRTVLAFAPMPDGEPALPHRTRYIE
jgi:1,4-alpha-glucan branching enzyme